MPDNFLSFFGKSQFYQILLAYEKFLDLIFSNQALPIAFKIDKQSIYWHDLSFC